MLSIIKRVIPSKNDRELKKLQPRVGVINAFEPEIKKLSDDQLKAKTGEFKERVEKGESLESLLPEAFAVVREAGWRTVKMRHFDVQLVGGMVLHAGKVAEMRTGEGKTLVATLPAYLNALEGKGVHCVTVNDYLARRDAEWMGKIYRYLGLEVGVIVHGFDDDHKKRQYNADITYGTNSEFGFDYLRDNMKVFLSEYTQQRGLHYAIVDEVDSVLIDEARTPLIISGPAEESTERYIEANKIVSKLRPERDYTVDEKSKSAVFTDEGVDRVEGLLKVRNLYAPENIDWLHHVTKGLQSHACYKRDVDYLVTDGEVLIIDEHTGRTMEGRRWSDGLHQAIEAKEGVKIQRENVTLATITYQNLYRMYNKLSGMTGTADTEAEELNKIYKLEVMIIPTNMPMIRGDNDDLVYKTEAEKFTAVVEDITERNERGQPVLVGTRSVDKSDVLSRLLKKHKIGHTVLNAKFHRREGEIIAQAGQLGTVTISTNMAGRGTDILLGGNPEYLSRDDVAAREMGETNDPERHQQILAEFRWLTGSADSIPTDMISSDYAEKMWQEKLQSGELAGMDDELNVGQVKKQVQTEARAMVEDLIAYYGERLEKHRAVCDAAKVKVLEAGGLHVLGTERHESRRVDNQLRGRAGRQGDPGSSQFYLSLEDDLMRMFGGEKLVGMMDRLGMEDGVPIEARMVSKSIEGAQRRVEGHNFDIRKNLIEYDDVMNQQRKSIYGLRRKILGEEPMDEDLFAMYERVVVYTVERTCPAAIAPDEWRIEALGDLLRGLFAVQIENLQDRTAVMSMRPEEIEDMVYQAVELRWNKKISELEADYAVVDEALVPKAELPVTAKVKEPVSRYLLRQIYLQEIDRHWREHLTQMDHLKEGIHLRGYGQRDPKIEYKREGFEYFAAMMREIDHNVVSKLFHVEFKSSEEIERERLRQIEKARAMQAAARLAAAQQADAGADSVEGSRPAAAKKRPGRNDPCWCGSGKKYKKCHLPQDEEERRASV
jgi:preprotein translocase subunit SecA